MARLFDELATQDLRDLSAQDWGVIDRRLPDQRPIDAEVLVNQDVSQPHDVRPRHRVMPRREFGAEPRHRFADDRQLLSDGVAERFVGDEIGLRSSGYRFRNPVQRLQDIVQTLRITPHRSAGHRPARRAGGAASVPA